MSGRLAPSKILPSKSSATLAERKTSLRTAARQSWEWCRKVLIYLWMIGWRSGSGVMTFWACCWKQRRPRPELRWPWFVLSSAASRRGAKTSPIFLDPIGKSWTTQTRSPWTPLLLLQSRKNRWRPSGPWSACTLPWLTWAVHLLLRKPVLQGHKLPRMTRTMA